MVFSKPKVRLEQYYRYDLQDELETEDLYLGRLAIDFSSNPQKKLGLSGFFEAHHNFDSGRISHQELGLEFSNSLHPWIQWREAIQQVFLAPGKDRPELESRLLIHFPLPPTRWGIQLYGLEEHTYDLEFGKAARNEIAGGVRIPLKIFKYVWMGWRHIDHVHSFDSDMLEAGFTMEL